MVGGGEQVLGRHTRPQQRHPDADADRQPGRHPLEVGRPYRAPDPLGHLRRRGQVGVQEHGELVPGVPDRHVLGPAVLQQDARDHPEYLVADAVRVRVVDLLEVIDIDHEQRDGRRQGTRVDAGHELVEVPPVAEAGQRVADERQFGTGAFGLQLLPLLGLAEHADPLQAQLP